MREINDVQVEILRDVSEVCKKLGIKFFMVHGSLLGTIRNNSFVPDDDDIDIAFFREDYETFLREAPKLLKPHLFVQSNSSDEEYPLEFSKVRDSRTTYVIEIAKHLNINHGIYIDVFPIDYYPSYGKLRRKFFNLKHKLLKIRIKSVWRLKNVSLAKRISGFLAKLYCPSVKRAVKRIDKMLKSVGEGELIRVSGGKQREQGIPRRWFDKAEESVFEGVPVYIPGGFDDYLKKIYGNYETRTLVEKKDVSEESIEVNACVVDTEKPYTEYIQ